MDAKNLATAEIESEEGNQNKMGAGLLKKGGEGAERDAFLSKHMPEVFTNKLYLMQVESILQKHN